MCTGVEDGLDDDARQSRPLDDVLLGVRPVYHLGLGIEVDLGRVRDLMLAEGRDDVVIRKFQVDASDFVRP